MFSKGVWDGGIWTGNHRGRTSHSLGAFDTTVCVGGVDSLVNLKRFKRNVGKTASTVHNTLLFYFFIYLSVSFSFASLFILFALSFSFSFFAAPYLIRANTFLQRRKSRASSFSCASATVEVPTLLPFHLTSHLRATATPRSSSAPVGLLTAVCPPP